MYGATAFSQTYVYEADDKGNEGSNGMYHKYVKGAKLLLDLPTVLYDVQKTSSGYDYLAEFSCVNVLGIGETTELRYSARENTIDSEILKEMMDTSIAAGIPEDIVNSMKIVDFTNCTAPTPSQLSEPI